MMLKGKTTLITGSTSGIGPGMAGRMPALSKVRIDLSFT